MILWRSLNSIYLKDSFHQLQAAFIQEFELFCGKNMFCFSLSTGLGKEYHATLLCLENETCTGPSYAASSWGAGNSQQQIGNCFLQLVCLQIISPWFPQSSLFIEKKKDMKCFKSKYWCLLPEGHRSAPSERVLQCPMRGVCCGPHCSPP